MWTWFGWPANTNFLCNYGVKLALKDNTFCAVSFNSRLKIIFLQLYLIFSKKKIYIYKSLFSCEKILYGWFTKKGKIIIKNRGIGEIKGLYYDINLKAIDLAESYYKQHLENLYFLSFLNKSMRTDKFSCYIKKELSYYFFDILSSLYLIKEFSKGNKIIIINSLPNKFVLDRYFDDNKITFEICWVKFNFLRYFLPVIFIIILLKKLFTNGFAYRDRVNTRIYKYAVWGTTRLVLRDDFIIDYVAFGKDDIVFYTNPSDKASKSAGKQLTIKGYSLIDINNCKLNIKNGFLSFINIFIVHPLILSIVLFYEKTGYLIEEMMKFYWVSFPHFLFLTNFNVKCHISTSDHGEIAETILMNRFGCKNILYHWSDMTVAKGILHAYTVHNVYYTWGHIHHDFQHENYYHDKVEVVGCILLRAYFNALIRPEQSIKINTSKKILICDSSFSNVIHFSEEFYLDYLDLVINMMAELTDVEFIFKPKGAHQYSMNQFTSEERKRLYLEKMDYLLNDNRFFYYDYNIQLETLIATSDLVVNMGMNSPATIAFILGKEAVYYDTTGNDMHPFTKYKNQVVFDNKRMLIDHVKDVLNNKKSAFEYIDTDLLNQYEPYKDSNAIDRLIFSIHKETVTR